MTNAVIRNQNSGAMRIIHNQPGIPAPFGWYFAFVGSLSGCKRYVEQNGG